MTKRSCIANAKIVDIAAESVLADTYVLMECGRIKDLALQPPSPSEWQIFDAKGRHLVPGLIDGHVHFVLDCGANPRTSFLQSDEKLLWETGKRNASTALRAGITTVRDCGAPAPWIFEFQQALARGEFPGPRVVSSGCPLMRRGGHLHYFGGEVSTKREVRNLVEHQAMAGAAFVKLIASGGGLTPGTKPAEADLPLSLMREAVEVAHALHVRAAAHCHATESIRRAIEAGVDTIEHASFIAADGDHRFDPLLAAQISDRGIAVCATVIGALKTASALQGRQDETREHHSDLISRLEARRTNLATFVGLGIPLFGGTDSGITHTPFDSLADEIVLHHESGMSPAQCLRAFTIDGARHLGLPHTGEVKPGYVADLLLLDGNPLEDLACLHSPDAVFQGGNLVVARNEFASAVASHSFAVKLTQSA